MEELAQSQALLASQKQLLAAMKGVQDQISQLEKRNKAQGQRTQQGKRRFGDAPEDGYVEPKPPDPSWITPHHTSSTHKHLTHSYLYFKPVNEVKIYSFSGSSWPERKAEPCHQTTHGSAYKWWKGVDGARWKSQREAIKTWEDLKEAMIRKYVSSLPTPEIRERYPRRFSSHGSKEAKRVVPQQGHRSLIHQDQIGPNQGHTVLYDQSQPYEVPKTMERKNFVSQDTLARHKEKSDKPIFQEKGKVSPILDKFVYKSSPTGMSHLSLSKDVKTGPKVQKDTNSTSLLRSKVVHDLSPRDKEILNPKEEEPSSQGKSSKSEDLKYQTCYRCHKKGHYAVVCPTKQVLIEASLEKKTDLSMKSDSFIQSDLLVPNSCVMHLSLSKGVLTGIKEHEFKGEEPPGATPVMNQEKVQDTMQSMLLKEAKPVNKVSNQGKCQTPPRETGIDVCVLDVESKNESYLLTEVPRREPDHKPSHEPPHKWKSSVEQCVQMPRLKVIFSDLKTSKTLDYPDIMHLSLPKSFDPGIKEVEVHNHQGQKMQRRQQTRTSCPKKKIILQLVEAIKNVEKFSGCKGESFKKSHRIILVARVIQFRGRNLFKGEGMLRPEIQQLNQ
ncbi:uncharacterized protein LOC117131518, partial [Brassica rapa]|uniref:uncharacterized protein LOC117131518 n=1 Tax=Brassica campestris TaxID=3711 RepID=UPI00142E62C2